MKRILHCIRSVDTTLGGPQHFVKQCAMLQQLFGIEIEVASLDVPEASCLSSFPCKVHPLGSNDSTYGYSSRFIPWLQANHSRFDMTVVDGLWQFPTLGTWLALRRSKAPYVVFSDGMLDPWFNERYPLKALKKQLYWLLAEHWALKGARAVLFTSLHEKERAQGVFWPYCIPQELVHYGTLESSFDLNHCKAVFFARFPELQEKKFLLFLGRIHEKKGCDLLLNSFAEKSKACPDWHLVMAGPECEYSKALQLEFDSLQLHVTWTGMLENEMKWGALASASALVLPSHQENFALVVSEALSCGTPVLISNRVNIWQEIIAHGAGIADDDTLEGTLRTISRWLSEPEAERQKMRNQARNCWQANFDMKITFSRYLQCLDSLAANPISKSRS